VREEENRGVIVGPEETEGRGREANREDHDHLIRDLEVTREEVQLLQEDLIAVINQGV